MIEIRSLNNIDFDTIFKAFSKAFADYEVQQDKEELQFMLKRRGFNPDLSFAAFEGDDIVAFTLNGIGDFNKSKTAYDTGTGTVKEYRGRGLAAQIFEFSIPYLKNSGVKQYLLEVLQHNTKAISVYKNIGFEVVREFNYFKQENEKINCDIEISSSFLYSIEQIDIRNFDFIQTFWDFYPSWQNNIESIDRSVEGFVHLGAFKDEKLVGYCIFEPRSGDITQIAVDKQYRRKGIASLLFKELAKLNNNNTLKIINTDIQCSSIVGFLKSKNIEITGRQFEMIKAV